MSSHNISQSRNPTETLKTNPTPSNTVSQGNLLSPLSGVSQTESEKQSLRYEKLQIQSQSQVSQVNYDASEEEENVEHISELQSQLALRDELLVNNNKCERNPDLSPESEEAESLFDIVAEKDSQVCNK